MRDYRDYRAEGDFSSQGPHGDFRPRRPYRDFRDHQRHRWFFGFIIVFIGLAVLARQFHLLFLSIHLWPLILIALGLFIGVKSRFRSFGAFVLLAIGILYTIPRFVIMGVSSEQLALPAFLIFGGLWMMFRPNRQRCYPHKKNMTTISTNPEDTLDVHVTFGGRKANVTSKQFKGGTISTTFGGAEINLMQADSNETMVLDLQVSFGGVEIIVPSHWDVQIEIEPTFGNVEDHRVIRTASAEQARKLLILRGNCSFGNIELKSY